MQDFNICKKGNSDNVIYCKSNRTKILEVIFHLMNTLTERVSDTYL